MPEIKAIHDAVSGEVAHQGRLTASMTHEFKNVLAIIGETAGLMEDILETTPESLHNQRFNELLQKIQAQVDRGQRLATWLNRFAHLPDTRPCTVDPAQLTAQVKALAERLARLVEIRLELSECLEGKLKCDTVALHRALFMAMEYEWKRYPASSTLYVSCGPDESGYVWRLHGESSAGVAADVPLEMEASTAGALNKAGLTARREGGDLLLRASADATCGEEL